MPALRFLNQFTRHLAAELEATGVTANVIHPGDVLNVRRYLLAGIVGPYLGNRAFIKWA